MKNLINEIKKLKQEKSALREEVDRLFGMLMDEGLTPDRIDEGSKLKEV